MPTIHYIDAYTQFPAVEIGTQEHEGGSLLIDSDYAWANGQYLMPPNPFALADQPEPEGWYICRSMTGAVYTDTTPFITPRTHGSASIRCQTCSAEFVMLEGQVYAEDDPRRPVMRHCCYMLVCANCHPEFTAWECEDCGSDHCTGLRSYICDDCGSVTCVNDHCASDEDDPDRRYADDNGSTRYRARSVNTDVRLRGEPVEKARGARFVGVEIEAEGGDGENLDDMIPDLCGITGDGSLHYGVEIQTPPARGSVFVEIVEKVVDTLSGEGWSTSDRCGLHVHVDMADKRNNGEFLGRLYAAFFAVEPLLFRLQGGRRDNNSYCEPLRTAFGGTAAKMRRKSSKKIMAEYHGLHRQRHETQQDFDYRLESYMADKYHQSRYRATNFHSIGCHGTLEIRLHEGTLDATEILAWADMIQSIIRACEDDRWPGGHKIRFASDPIKAQRMFRFTRATREYMVNRLNADRRRSYDPTGGRWVLAPAYTVTPGSITEVRS
jgi:hypothetical protein